MLNGQKDLLRVIPRSELNVNEVYRVIEDNDQVLWIASDQGLWKYNGSYFDRIKNSQFSNEEIVHTRYDEKHKLIWCQNLIGEFGYVRNDSIIKVDLNLSNWHIIDFCSTSKHIFLILARTNLNSIIRFDLHPDGLIDTTTIYKVTPQHFLNAYPVRHSPGKHAFCIKDTIYVNTSKTLIKVFKDQIVSANTSERLFPVIPIYDSTGIYLLTDNNSILHYSHDLEYIQTLDQNLSTDDIYGSIDGKNIIVLPYSGGAFSLSVDSPQDIVQKLPSSFKCNSHYVDSRGLDWYGTLNSGLIQGYNNGIKFYSLSKFESSNVVDLLEHENNLYVALASNEILNVEKDSFRLVSKMEDRIKKLKKGKDNKIAVIGNSFFFDSIQDQTPVRQCIKDLYTENNFTYLAYCKGLIIRDSLLKDRIRRYDVVKRGNNLLSSSPYGLIETEISSFKNRPLEKWPKNIPPLKLTLGPDHRLWVNTEKSGVYKETDNGFEKLENDVFGTDTIIKNMVLIKDELWLFSSQNVFRHNVNSGKTIRITGELGLPNIPYNTVSFWSKRYWLGSEEGIFSIPEDLLSNGIIEEEVSIVKTLVNGQNVDISLLSKLKHFQNNITINLDVKDFHNTAKPQYYYSLKTETQKHETSPSVADKPKLAFMNLGPGKYTLEISKSSKYNDTSNLISLEINISKPFWQTGTFIVFTVLLTSILFITLYYLIIRTIRQRRKNLFELKNQLGELELVTLQQELNPHFINNITDSMLYYIENEERHNAISLLDRFSVLMRTSFELSGAQLISVHDEIKFLKSYFDIQVLIKEREMDLNIDIIPSANNLDSIFLPSMLIQPFIENAIKYKSEARKLVVDLKFEIKKPYLTIRISDNGKGYTSKRNGNHKKSSLGIIEKRLQLLNQSKEAQIKIGPNTMTEKGTIVSFKVRATYKSSLT